jgi:hypothetical protein
VRFGGGGEACVRGWREGGGCRWKEQAAAVILVVFSWGDWTAWDPGQDWGFFFLLLLLFSIFENLFSYLVRFDLFETKKGDPLCVPFRLPYNCFILCFIDFDSFAHLIPN